MKRCYEGGNGTVYGRNYCRHSFRGLWLFMVVDNIHDVYNIVNVYCFLYMQEEIVKG